MMRSVILLALSAAALASPYPQGVTAIIAPSAAIPTQCTASYSGKFGVAVVTDIPFTPVQTAPAGFRRNAAPQEPESTVTVRSTRYHTKTVTVEPASRASAPAVGPVPDFDMSAAGVTPATNAFIVSQLGTGQVQISVASEISDPSAGGPASNSRVVMDGPSGGLQGCAKDDSLQITLANGVLKDAKGRTGYIADNRQFQFDDPPQHGALYTAGFSVCNNGTLALGGTSVWWQCRSGDFYNLYDKWIAPQCSPVHINVIHLNTC